METVVPFKSSICVSDIQPLHIRGLSVDNMVDTFGSRIQLLGGIFF